MKILFKVFLILCLKNDLAFFLMGKLSVELHVISERLLVHVWDRERESWFGCKEILPMRLLYCRCERESVCDIFKVPGAGHVMPQGVHLARLKVSFFSKLMILVLRLTGWTIIRRNQISSHVSARGISAYSSISVSSSLTSFGSQNYQIHLWPVVAWALDIV